MKLMLTGFGREVWNPRSNSSFVLYGMIKIPHRMFLKGRKIVESELFPRCGMVEEDSEHVHRSCQVSRELCVGVLQCSELRDLDFWGWM